MNNCQYIYYSLQMLGPVVISEKNLFFCMSNVTDNWENKDFYGKQQLANILHEPTCNFKIKISQFGYTNY